MHEHGTAATRTPAMSLIRSVGREERGHKSASIRPEDREGGGSQNGKVTHQRPRERCVFKGVCPSESFSQSLSQSVSDPKSKENEAGILKCITASLHLFVETLVEAAELFHGLSCEAGDGLT